MEATTTPILRMISKKVTGKSISLKDSLINLLKLMIDPHISKLKRLNRRRKRKMTSKQKMWSKKK